MAKNISNSHKNRSRGHVLLWLLIVILFVIVMLSLGYMVELILG